MVLLSFWFKLLLLEWRNGLLNVLPRWNMTETHHKHIVGRINSKKKKHCFIFHRRAKASILHFIMSLRFKDVCVRKRSTQSGRRQSRRFVAAWSGEGGDGATPGPEDNEFSFEVWTGWERGLKEQPGAFLGGCGGLKSGWFPLDWQAAAAGIPPVTAVTWHLFKPDGPLASAPHKGPCTSFLPTEQIWHRGLSE